MDRKYDITKGSFENMLKKRKNKFERKKSKRSKKTIILDKKKKRRIWTKGKEKK